MNDQSFLIKNQNTESEFFCLERVCGTGLFIN
jgi:hypothetical protein